MINYNCDKEPCVWREQCYLAFKIK